MKPYWFYVLIMMMVCSQLQAQKYFSKNAQVSFFSKTPIENIEAINKKGTVVVDFTTGSLEFSVLIKAFQFEKALMQEHFNENYMESDKFPKANFKGQITNISNLKMNSSEKQLVNLKGDLTIHGVSKPVIMKGFLTFKESQWLAESDFTVKVADYDIKIPAVVKDNIAKEIDVKVVAKLDVLKS
jgi:polyisoprenoid-binding protein YceI